jgi:hypothetical protein
VTVKNLPIGIPFDFRVKAYNSGGWSQFSESSTRVTPGKEYDPISMETRWALINQGGVLSIIDILQHHNENRYVLIMRSMKLSFDLI